MWSVVAFQPWWTMDREPSISKYWVSRGSGRAASSKVGRRLAPSTGCWVTPSTAAGAVDAHRVEHGRHEVDDVGELRPDLAPAR